MLKGQEGSVVGCLWDAYGVLQYGCSTGKGSDLKRSIAWVDFSWSEVMWFYLYTKKHRDSSAAFKAFMPLVPKQWDLLVSHYIQQQSVVPAWSSSVPCLCMQQHLQSLLNGNDGLIKTGRYLEHIWANLAESRAISGAPVGFSIDFQILQGTDMKALEDQFQHLATLSGRTFFVCIWSEFPLLQLVHCLLSFLLVFFLYVTVGGL